LVVGLIAGDFDRKDSSLDIQLGFAPDGRGFYRSKLIISIPRAVLVCKVIQACSPPGENGGNLAIDLENRKLGYRKMCDSDSLLLLFPALTTMDIQTK